MTTATTTLTDFLLARIAEDQADAREHATGWWPNLWRAKAECEAKRRIVESVSHDYRWNKDHAGDLAQMVLDLLALPYADHPDYREEWKP